MLTRLCFAACLAAAMALPLKADTSDIPMDCVDEFTFGVFGCNNTYYQCNHGAPVEKHCPGKLFFDIVQMECLAKFQVDACTRGPGGRIFEQNNNKLPDCTEGVRFVSNRNCTRFYGQCSNGDAHRHYCPYGQVWVQEEETCDLVERVQECKKSSQNKIRGRKIQGSYGQPAQAEPLPIQKPAAQPYPQQPAPQVIPQSPPQQVAAPGYAPQQPQLPQSPPSQPSAYGNSIAQDVPAAPKIEFDCSDKADGVYVPDRNACVNTFFKCANLRTFKYDCPQGLWYDNEDDKCNYKEYVPMCGGTRPPPTTPAPARDVPTTNFDCSGKAEGSVHTEQECGPNFIHCIGGFAQMLSCPGNLVFDMRLGACDYPEQCNAPLPQSKPQNDFGHGGSPSGPYGQAPAPLAQSPPQAPKFDCSAKTDGYYEISRCTTEYAACNGQIATVLQCPSGLVFDSRLSQCAFIEQCKAPIQQQAPPQSGAYGQPQQPQQPLPQAPAQPVKQTPYQQPQQPQQPLPQAPAQPVKQTPYQQPQQPQQPLPQAPARPPKQTPYQQPQQPLPQAPAQPPKQAPYQQPQQPQQPLPQTPPQQSGYQKPAQPLPQAPPQPIQQNSGYQKPQQSLPQAPAQPIKQTPYQQPQQPLPQAPAQPAPSAYGQTIQQDQPQMKSTISCANLQNGAYPMTKCGADYVQCWNKVATSSVCHAGLVFNAFNGQCDYSVNVPECPDFQPQVQQDVVPTPAPAPVDPFCERLADGTYSKGCSETYYICRSAVTTKMGCPSGLFFDLEMNICNHKEEITACGGRPSQPAQDQPQAGPYGQPQQPQKPLPQAPAQPIQQNSGYQQKPQQPLPQAPPQQNNGYQQKPQQPLPQAPPQQSGYQKPQQPLPQAPAQPIQQNSGYQQKPQQPLPQAPVQQSGYQKPAQPLPQAQPVITPMPQASYQRPQAQSQPQPAQQFEQKPLPQVQQPKIDSTFQKSPALDTTIEPSCLGKPDGIYSFDKCTIEFYQCKKQVFKKKACEGGLFFNAMNGMCDQKDRVVACGGSLPPTGPQLPQQAQPQTAQYGQQQQQPLPQAPAQPVAPQQPLPQASPYAQPAASQPSFSCSGKQDGFYATGCSNTYWGCVNGMAVQHSCNGNDLWFTAEGSRCDYKEFVPECGGRTPAPQPQPQQPAQSPPQMVQGCQGKMDGIYPTTSCTKQYLSCVGGLGMLNNCHDGLIFNEAISACDYKENVLSCGGQAPAQDVPQQPIQPRPTLTFDCTGLEDGYWSTRQCSDKYAYCQMGQATMEANCPAGTAFFNRAQQCLNKNNHPECVRQQPQPQQMLPQSQPQQQQQPNYGGLSQPLPAQDSNPCSGKVNGLYSQGCNNKYVMCNNFAPSTFFCPGSLVFDDVTKRCTYANQVSGCMSPVLPQSPVIRTPQPFPQPFVQPQPMFQQQMAGPYGRK